MSVRLTNLGPRMLVFVLPHESYCSARGGCACGATPGRTRRRVPWSLTLPRGGEQSGLDEAVLVVPAVATALRRGTLRAEREEPPPPTQPSAELPVTAPEVTVAAGGEGPEDHDSQPKKKRGSQ